MKINILKKKVGNWLGENREYLIVSLIFLLVYGLLSVVKHFNFQTAAFDMGIFNQSLFLYAHGWLGPNTIRQVATLFGDHFEPIMLLISPLYYIFRSYTLLLVQIVAVIFGGTGVYLLVKKETNDKKLAVGSLLIFHLFYGVYDAIVFDYHNGVLGIMLIPWLFYFWARRRWGWYYLMLVSTLLCKENLALMLFCLGFSIWWWSDKRDKKHGLITAGLSVVYFLVVIYLIIPQFNEGKYDHWLSYAKYGATPVAGLIFFLTHPWELVKLFFDDIQKIKTWGMILMTGGILAFGKPKYSLILLPVLAQKFLSANPVYWGHIFHYSIEFSLVIAIGVGVFLGQVKKPIWKYGLMVFFVIMNVIVLNSVHFYDGRTIRNVFLPKNYQIGFDRNDVWGAMKMIPAGAAVSAQNTLVSHLADRRKIFLYPAVEDSEYIIFNLKDFSFWPTTKEDVERDVLKYEQSGSGWDKVFDKGGVVLFRKINN